MEAFTHEVLIVIIIFIFRLVITSCFLAVVVFSISSLFFLLFGFFILIIIRVVLVLELEFLAVLVDLFLSNGIGHSVLVLNFLLDLLTNIAFVTLRHVFFPLDHAIVLVNVVQGNGHVLVDE